MFNESVVKAISSVAAVGSAAVAASAYYGRPGQAAHYYEKVFENLIDTNIDDDPRSDLFNGLDKIGGDPAKWEEARAFIQGMNEHDALMAEKLGIICLDKPSGVLFGGMTGPEKKLMKTLVDAQDNAYTQIKNMLAVHNASYTAKGDTEKAALVTDIVPAIAPFVEVDDANDPIDVAIKGIDQGFLDDINRDLATRKATLAGIGSSFSGIKKEEIRALKEKSSAVYLKEGAEAFLPIMTEEEIKKMDPTSKALMDKTRKHWPAYFKNVNVSRAKRVGLLSLALRKKNTKVHSSWITKYKGRPLLAQVPAKTPDATKKIWEDTMKEFKDHIKYWNKNSFRETFNRLPDAPYVAAAVGAVLPGTP